MKISKQMIRQLEGRAKKASRIQAVQGKSDNEIAEGFAKATDFFLNSPDWKILRRKAIQEYGAKCMKCGYIPDSPRQINVDHIKPRKYYPSLALEFSNLQILCCSCNKQKGNKNEIDYRPK